MICNKQCCCPFIFIKAGQSPEATLKYAGIYSNGPFNYPMKADEILVFPMPLSMGSNIDGQTSDKITIKDEGVYKIDYSTSIYLTDTNYKIQLMKNDEVIMSRNNFAIAGVISNNSGTFITYLNSGDVLTLQLTSSKESYTVVSEGGLSVSLTAIKIA